jgi:predicted alpha/beta-fold hydrolase
MSATFSVLANVSLSTIVTGLCVGIPLFILLNYLWYQRVVKNTNETIEIYSKYGVYLDQKAKLYPASKEPKNAKRASVRRSLDLFQKVQTICSKTPFFPSFYCLYDYHGYMQTGVQFTIRNLSRLFLRYFYPNTEYYLDFDREIIRLPDNGTVAIDWLLSSSKGKSSKPNKNLIPDKTKPILIIHHGLTGDSQSEYFYHLLYKLQRLKMYSKIGIMIARGCGGLSLTSFTTFSGRRSYDLFYVIRYLKRTHPDNKLFWMGFSLGAAITLHYLEDFSEIIEEEEEEQEQSPEVSQASSSSKAPPASETKSEQLHRKQQECGLDAALCVSPPWNLDRQSLGMNLWSILMIIPLKLYLLQHLANFRKFNPFTGNPEIKHMTVSRLLRMIDINELDRFCYRFYGTEYSLDYVKETADSVEYISASSEFHEKPEDKDTVPKTTDSKQKEEIPINPHIHIRYKQATVPDEKEMGNYHHPLTATQYKNMEEEKDSSEVAEGDHKPVRNFDTVKATIQYHSLEEYYLDTSPKYKAHQVTTPTLAISSRDDPICAHWECPKKPNEIGSGLVVVRIC